MAANAKTQPQPAEQVEKCSNTGCINALDTTGYPKWCKACRAAYKREERVLQEHRYKARGYAAGVKAMREYLVEQFTAARTIMWTGEQLASIVRGCPGPKLEEGD